MLRRYLILATLIASSVACSNTRNERTTVRRSLGPGGRAFARVAGETAPTGSCLNLVEQAKTLRAQENGVAIHSRDYDLGTLGTGMKDRRVSFKSATDKMTRELRARRAFSGENAPVYKVTSTPAELLDQAPLSELLGIDTQQGCASVKFKSGAEFKVLRGDQRSLNLENSATHEQREYIWSLEGLVINVFAPVELKTCDGGVSPAKFERISTRLTWGVHVGTVKLVPEYAALLELSPSASYVQLESKIKGLPAKLDKLTCSKE